MLELKNKLLKKYKNSVLIECPFCNEKMEFSPECKNGCWQKVNNALKFINAGIPNKYIDLPSEVFNEYTQKSNVQRVRFERQKVYEVYQEYIKNLFKNLENGKGFFLYGGFGTGKSTLSMNIAKKAIELGKNVVVREFAEMVKISQSGYAVENEIPLDIFQEFVNADLYCIENLDWVYQKSNSDYVSMFLDNLISFSSKYSIPVVITSNMSIKDIKSAFNEHIFSVLHENCIISNVPGEDIRLKK